MAKTKTTRQTKSTAVTIDRRKPGERRSPNDRRQDNVRVAHERRSGSERRTNRRRQIDPTTCERDYSAAEVEFMHALDAYKRVSGRMFPTCSEILEVVQSLGYQKQHAEVPVTTSQSSPGTIERELEAALDPDC